MVPRELKELCTDPLWLGRGDSGKLEMLAPLLFVSNFLNNDSRIFMFSNILSNLFDIQTHLTLILKYLFIWLTFISDFT